jgi:PTS system nitrogen regulatory IIA component
MRLTVRDVAKLLNVSEKTVYRWVKEGKLPGYRVNEQYRFNQAEILEWATSRKIKPSVEIFHEPESAGAPRSVAEALRAGGIYYRIDGGDKPTVLRAVVDVVRLPDGIDRDFLYQVLIARESLGSTAIGDGIAIPHVRNPIVLHVSEPSITLCFLERPIDYGALDGQPVHTLLTLITPTVRTHLQLLSRIAFVLHDERVKAVLTSQGSREEILSEIARVEATIPGPAQELG